MAATERVNRPCLDVLKRKMRAVLSTPSCFYNSSWLTNTDRFLEAVARFAEIIADSHTMDSSLQQLIVSAVTFVVAIAVSFIQTKHES